MPVDLWSVYQEQKAPHQRRCLGCRWEGEDAVTGRSSLPPQPTKHEVAEGDQTCGEVLVRPAWSLHDASCSQPGTSSPLKCDTKLTN